MTPEKEWHWATAHSSYVKAIQLDKMEAPLGRKLNVKRLHTCNEHGACAICMQVKLTKPRYEHAEVGKFFDLQPFELVACDESGVIFPMAHYNLKGVTRVQLYSHYRGVFLAVSDASALNHRSIRLE